jgi:hypothetical protein
MVLGQTIASEQAYGYGPPRTNNFGIMSDKTKKGGFDHLEQCGAETRRAVLTARSTVCAKERKKKRSKSGIFDFAIGFQRREELELLDGPKRGELYIERK